MLSFIICNLPTSFRLSIMYSMLRQFEIDVPVSVFSMTVG